MVVSKSNLRASTRMSITATTLSRNNGVSTEECVRIWHTDQQKIKSVTSTDLFHDIFRNSKFRIRLHDASNTGRNQICLWFRSFQEKVLKIPMLNPGKEWFFKVHRALYRQWCRAIGQKQTSVVFNISQICVSSMSHVYSSWFLTTRSDSRGSHFLFTTTSNT